MPIFTDPVFVCESTDALFSFLREKKKAVPCLLAVADENTAHALSVFQNDAVVCDTLILPAGFSPDEQACRLIMEKLSEKFYDAVIACGTQTLHDTLAFCAASREIPMISAPTAATSDAFLSETADMIWRGQWHRESVSPPVALFKNRDIIASAPEKLTASGCVVLLSHHLSLLEKKLDSQVSGKPLPDGLPREEASLAALERFLDRKADGILTKTESASFPLWLLDQLLSFDSPREDTVSRLAMLWRKEEAVGKNHLYGEVLGVAALTLCRMIHDSLPKKLMASPSIGKYTAVRLCAEIERLIPSGKLENDLKKLHFPTTPEELGLPAGEAFPKSARNEIIEASELLRKILFS